MSVRLVPTMSAISQKQQKCVRGDLTGLGLALSPFNWKHVNQSNPCWLLCHYYLCLWPLTEAVAKMAHLQACSVPMHGHKPYCTKARRVGVNMRLVLHYPKVFPFPLVSLISVVPHRCFFVWPCRHKVIFLPKQDNCVEGVRVCFLVSWGPLRTSSPLLDLHPHHLDLGRPRSGQKTIGGLCAPPPPPCPSRYTMTTSMSISAGWRCSLS